MKIFINEKDVIPVKYEDYSFKEMLGEKTVVLRDAGQGSLYILRKNIGRVEFTMIRKVFLYFPAAEMLWSGTRSFLWNQASVLLHRQEPAILLKRICHAAA
jgi:hypothetical protein